MKQGRLEISKSWSHISGHPEVSFRIFVFENIFVNFVFLLLYLKYGSWSIAHGIRQGTVFLSPKMKGKEEEKLGAA